MCSDYDKGVLTSRVFRAIVEGRGSRSSPSIRRAAIFASIAARDLLTPNEKELADATPAHRRAARERRVKRRAESLMRALGFKALLVTRGASGMDLFELDRRTIRRTHIPALQRHEVFDVTGAGDTVAAVLTMAVAGRRAAGRRRENRECSGRHRRRHGRHRRRRAGDARQNDRRRSVAGALQGAVTQGTGRAHREARSHGSTVVFTSGSFDSLNVDDLRALQQARAQGELLVVGVNGDPSTGPQRAEMLAALRFVDYVTLFPRRRQPRSDASFASLRPDYRASKKTG